MPNIRVRRIKPNKLVMGTNIFNDVSVSLFARGLFCTAIAMAQDEGFNIKELMARVPEDPNDVYRGIMELRTLGYCKRVTNEGTTEFIFKERPSKKTQKSSRKASRVKNKEPHLYSKDVAQVQVHQPQSPEYHSHEDDDLGDWAEVEAPSSGSSYQPSLLPTRLPKVKGRDEVVPATAHRLLQRLCFMAETEGEIALLNSSDRGRIASALGKLQSARADLSQLNRFEDWWNKSWRSREKGSNAYQPPTPEQVVQNWNIAMKHESYKPEPSVPAEQKHIEVDLAGLMRNRATSRK